MWSGLCSTMSHNIQETVLGKRKRREATSVADKPQARIDQYFASKAPVKKASNENGHAAISDTKVQMVQVRCDIAAISQVGVGADAGQAQCLAVPQQQSQQPSGNLDLKEPGEQAHCAAEAPPFPAVQCEQPQHAKSAKATASKVGSKPHQARPDMHQPPHAMPKPGSAATAQPDLADHLSFFLSVLPERQHFRE